MTYLRQKEEKDPFVPKIVALAFRNCRPDWYLGAHFVANNEITYIMEGKACYTIDGKPHELGPGDLLCLARGSTKEAVTYPKKPMQCFSVTFDSLYPMLKSRAPSFPVISHIGPRKDLIALFEELTVSWSGQQPGYILKTRSLLMLILNRLSEILLYNSDSQAEDYYVNRATAIITMNYPDKLTVKNLAQMVHLNTSHFSRLFKRIKGMTVSEYIKQVRVRNAETMLQSGSYKADEVAGYCGFSGVAQLKKSVRGIFNRACKARLPS